MKIKTGDTVVVIAGKDSKTVTKKGVESTTGKVLKVYPETNKVIVEGANMVKKHIKPNGQTAGSIVEVEAPINASNVMIVDPKTSKRTRIGHTTDKKGNKVRVSKKSNEQLN